MIGVVSIAGAELGVQLASRLDETHLRRAFGVLLLGVAAQLALSVVRAARRYPEVP